MSSGVVKSASGKTDIPPVRTKIPLTSAAVAKGLSVAGGNFVVTDPGTYFLNVELNAFSPSGDRGFLLEVYDETGAVIVASQRQTAPRQDYGEDLWFGLQFDVTDVTHEHAFYITPDSQGAGFSGRAVVLDRQNLRAELCQYSSSGSMFGDGRDGSIAYNGVAWLDGDGAALATVAGKWNVNGATLTLLRNFRFVDVTVGNGGVLQSGRDGQAEVFHHRVNGTMTVANGATVRAGLSRPNNDGDTTSSPGRITSADGSNSPANSPIWRIFAGMPGNPGHGGIAVVNNTALASTETTALTLSAAALTPRGILGSIPFGVPTTNAAAAAVPASMSFIPSPVTPLLPGLNGFAGGAGALDLGGLRVDSISGVGGAGGRGGGAMRWDVYALVIPAGGVMHADAEAGTAGGPGVATDNAGDIAGGGGGGAGGGGGMVLCFVRTATLGGVAWTPETAVAPYLRAAGGAGEVGGLGYEFDDVLRPAADGVAGTAGSAGVVGIGRLV